MPWSCVRGARGRSGGSELVPVLACPLGLLPALASLVVRVAGCAARFSLPFACRYAIPCGLCIPGLGLVAPWVRAACPLLVCALVVPRRTPPPPTRVGVACAVRAVPVQCPGRAVARGSCPSKFPAPVPCSAYLALWGVAGSLRPLAWLGFARPPASWPAFLRWVCALWGLHEGARGGWRLSPGSGASGAGRFPMPVSPSLGRGAGARYPLAVGAGGVGVGTHHHSHSARSCKLAVRAVGAARGHPGRLLPWCGASRVERSPTPDCPSLARAAGACYPLAVGAGGAGLATRHQSHSARSCELALRAVGAARGRLPGAAPLAWPRAVRGWALALA